MNVAEWIIVSILSFALLAFLILGIITMIRWRRLADEATKIAVKGQDVVDTAGDVVENVRDFTSLGRIIKTVSDTVVENAAKAKKSEKSEKSEKSDKSTKSKSSDDSDK